MRNVGRVILWVILGAVLGSAVGIIARRLGFADVSGGILGGMISAPAILMLILLFDYVDELIFWAIGGAIVGALLLTGLGAFAGQTTGSAGLGARFSLPTAINGALVGSVLATWLGAGALVFKRGMIGLVALLISVVAGGFLGAESRGLDRAVRSGEFPESLVRVEVRRGDVAGLRYRHAGNHVPPAAERNRG